MRLEQLVINSLRNYPTLYRVKDNPKLSRLHIYNQLFFTIGNGYEWNNGFLSDIENEPNTEIPLNYYDGDLWVAYVKKNKINQFVDIFSDFIFNERKGHHQNEHCLELLNPPEDLIESFFGEIKTSNRRISSFYKFTTRRTDDGGCYTTGGQKDLYPYPISDRYSPIVEMINGIDYYGNIVKPNIDFILGCRELSQETLFFLDDHSRLEQFLSQRNGFDVDNQRKHCESYIEWSEKYKHNDHI